MNRRGFLQFLGAAVAGAALPPAFSMEKIARAPSWAKEVILFRTSAPLAAGSYTFTAGAGELGMFVGGVRAFGGETVFEIPAHAGVSYTEPCLTKGGIVYSYDPGCGGYVPPPTRGEPVVRA